MSRSFQGVNMNTTIHAVVVTTALSFVLVDASAADSPGPGEPTLAEVRAVTEKYQDINVALAEGYIRDPSDMCGTAGVPRRDGRALFPPGHAGNHGTARPGATQSARERQWHAHGFPRARDPDLRAAGRRLHAARGGREPRVPGVVGGRRPQFSAD